METLSVEAIEKLLRCVNPVFEDLEPSQGKDEYVFRGSSFNVSFHGRLYLITAGHVVSGWPVANLRVFDLVTRNSLPFKGFHPRKSAEDTDDVAVFEIETEMLNADELTRLSPIVLDRQEAFRSQGLPRGGLFAVKGYPRVRGQVMVETATITNKPYEITGRDGGGLYAGLHSALYFTDIPITDLDGMSGAPWIVAGAETTSSLSQLAGLHISAAHSGEDISGIFITASGLLKRLKEIE